MSLSDLVDPDHAVIAGLLATVGAEDPVAGLRRELAQWRFETRLGPSGYERMASSRSGNCVDLATLLCSAVRRSGNRDCHVLLGSWRGAFPAAMHAWVLIRQTPPAWLVVDPNGMTQQVCTADEIERGLVIVAIFDDAGIVAGQAAREEFWRSGRPNGEEQHVKSD